MVSARAYRPTRTSGEAGAELAASAGTQLDTDVVAALMAEVAGEGRSTVEVDPNGVVPPDESDLHRLARLHALLESATVVEHADDLPRRWSRGRRSGSWPRASTTVLR